jgi:NAD(P)-dependent dehydrogenase (short-subunit alcohol dehydrogenase family)
MSGRLEGKVAIITGAASGQGAAAAALFASEGARVAAFDINEAGLKALDIDRAQLHTVVCDVTNSESVQHGIAAVMDRFGSVNVVYNNAGVIKRRPGAWDHTQDGPAADLSEAVFDELVGLNLKSQFLVCKYALPHMIAAGGGSIINVSSLGGPLIGTQNTAYNVAKAGVIGLTKALAVSYGTQGIRANAICPGIIDTPLVGYILADPDYTAKYTSAHPMGRFGKPAEIASVGLFLASDDASYVNGEVITADGGYMVRPK